MASSFVQKLKNVGPGALVAAGFVGPGTVTTCTVSGASYGYTMLWALLFATVATIIFQEMAARIGIVTQEGLGEILLPQLAHECLVGGSRAGHQHVVCGERVQGDDQARVEKLSLQRGDAFGCSVEGRVDHLPALGTLGGEAFAGLVELVHQGRVESDPRLGCALGFGLHAFVEQVEVGGLWGSLECCRLGHGNLLEGW